ncbi:MAG: DegV family protein [Clostridiales bacterium]|nr:DegV family protein [Clostridiales bacterium]
MNIKIIADSTSDIDQELLKDLDLEILPLVITVENREYLDGETISIPEIYDIMRRGIFPTTAQIPYERAYDLFRSCLENGNDIIYIAFSSAMSGCYSVAQMAAEELRAEFPERRITVLDSKGGSGATGLIVLQALRMASSGHEYDEILAEIIFMTEHVEHLFFVDDLQWLAKGGRVSKIVGTIGSKLGLHPMLEVKKGSIVFQKMIRGKKKSVRELADKLIERAAHFPRQLIAIAHADDLPSARELEELIHKGLPNCLTTICHIGCVLGAHIGLKGIGAFCFNQKSKH